MSMYTAKVSLKRLTLDNHFVKFSFDRIIDEKRAKIRKTAMKSQ